MKYFENETITSLSLDDLNQCEFIECRFQGIDLSQLELKYSRFIECEFVDSNLSNVNVLGASFREVKFSGCKLIGINWSLCNALFDLSFEHSNLSLNVFSQCKVPHTVFDQCQITEADFTEADLSQSKLWGSNLENAHFSRTNLTKADLSDAKNYNIDPTNNTIKEAKFSLPEALSLLSAYKIKIS